MMLGTPDWHRRCRQWGPAFHRHVAVAITPEPVLDEQGQVGCKRYSTDNQLATPRGDPAMGCVHAQPVFRKGCRRRDQSSQPSRAGRKGPNLRNGELEIGVHEKNLAADR